MNDFDTAEYNADARQKAHEKAAREKAAAAAYANWAREAAALGMTLDAYLAR